MHRPREKIPTGEAFGKTRHRLLASSWKASPFGPVFAVQTAFGPAGINIAFLNLAKQQYRCYNK